MSDDEVYVDFIAGWASGAVSVTLTQPVDTILTRIQANNVGDVGSSSRTLHSTTSFVRQSGMPSLWRGISAMVGAIPFQNALLMTGYGYGKRWCEEYHPDNVLMGVFVGGCTGGMVQSFLMSPVELIKVNQQVGGKSLSSATALVASGLFANNNLAWKGLGATLLRDGLPHGVWFASYEMMKQKLEHSQSFDKDKNSAFISLSSGAFAACTAWGVGYPFDIIKTRIQASGVENKTILGVTKEIINESNGRILSGLYRGFTLKLVKAVPSSAINFFVYEKVAKYLTTSH
jgi:solute carrier family 25 carnitine/acylcarnitine transporter 20/29